MSLKTPHLCFGQVLAELIYLRSSLDKEPCDLFKLFLELQLPIDEDLDKVVGAYSSVGWYSEA